MLVVQIALHRQTLSRMVRFYRTYPLVTTLRAQLAWSHYELLSALDDAAERTFYESEVVRSAWSVRELDEEIKSGRVGRAGWD